MIAGHRSPLGHLRRGFRRCSNPASTPATTWSSLREVIDRDGGYYPVEQPPGLAANVKYSSGRLLTVDQLVLRAAEKDELHRTYQADLVDMESSAVAAICREHTVRFLSIRVISDDASPWGLTPPRWVQDYQLFGQLSRRQRRIPALLRRLTVESQGFLVPL